MRIRHQLVLTVVALSLLPAVDATAQEPDQELIMRKWMEFMTPGQPHKMLAERSGSWDMKISMWTAPDAPPTETTGTSQMRMIMGGRYLIDRTESTVDGEKFQGMGITGYDNIKKKFVATWIDSMGTGIVQGEGKHDEASNSITYSLMSPDFANDKYKKVRSVEKFIDDDHWVAEMYDTTPDGKEYLNLKIRYSRRK